MNIDATKHAVTKGRILKLISGEYPGGVDFIVLQQVLHNINIRIGRSVLRGYLAYLEQIGYVTLNWQEDEDRGEKYITFAASTPKGLNFCDGLLAEPDPGVTRV